MLERMTFTEFAEKKLGFGGEDAMSLADELIEVRYDGKHTSLVWRVSTVEAMRDVVKHREKASVPDTDTNDPPVDDLLTQVEAEEMASDDS